MATGTRLTADQQERDLGTQPHGLMASQTRAVGPHPTPLPTGRPLWKLSHRCVGNYFYFLIFNISCNEKLKTFSCILN